MFFKKSRVKFRNKGCETHLILNGKDISNSVVEYKVTQEGGGYPEITIVCRPDSLDMSFDEIKNVEIKTK